MKQESLGAETHYPDFSRWKPMLALKNHLLLKKTSLSNGAQDASQVGEGKQSLQSYDCIKIHVKDYQLRNVSERFLLNLRKT